MQAEVLGSYFISGNDPGRLSNESYRPSTVVSNESYKTMNLIDKKHSHYTYYDQRPAYLLVGLPVRPVGVGYQA